ncbi:MAG: RHS repeat protein [Micrococcales bacterium]|nr:RHS repeat protein [Micrococcales bacterium]
MSELDPARDGVTVASAPLPGLTTTLFAQALPEQAELVTPLLDACGIGVTYTLNSQKQRWYWAGGPVEHSLKRSRHRNVLVDAARYAGKNPTPASAALDRAWVRFQQDRLALPWAIPDPGLCDRGDLAGVESILRETEKLPGRVLAHLPLSRYLLIEDADKVRDLIEKQDRTVLVSLKHADDPFGQQGVVPGFLNLSAGGASVGLLRTDQSAFGALVHGAPLAAIGTTPGLRHIPDGGGPPGEVKVSMFVPALMSFKYTSNVADAYLADPASPHWACPGCLVCASRGHLGWIPDLPEEALAATAIRHSIASLAGVARELGVEPDPRRALRARLHEARPHTRTLYDEGAPNSGINPATTQRYSLATTETSGVTDSAATVNATDLEVLSTTKTEYGKLNTADATEGDGWALGAATRVTTVKPGDTSGNIVKTTRYDTMGRVTDTRQPLSTGTDAGTTKTAYYTVAAQTAPNAVCGGRPEWAGLTCRTYPAAQPSGATLPDSVTTGYSMWLKPTSEVETSGTSTRTTTTTYDAAERPVTSKTVASGITGQSAATTRPGSFTKYDPATGLVAYTGNLNAAGTDAGTAGRTTSTYDRWGRVTTQVGDAGTVTTSYDAAGRVATVTDAKGTTTYGYDGTGERRGLTTSLTITRGGTAGSLTYGATYDADGNMTQQSLPGGITQVNGYDEGGEPTSLQYLGQVTPVTETTDPDTGDTTWTPGTPVQDQPWLTWSTTNDAAGRVRFEATGTGAAFDNGLGVASIGEVAPWTADANGQASSYAREYRYDFAGRLITAQDASSSLDPATGDLVAACTTRAYTFDKNGRRTQLATTTRDGGDCDTTGTTTTVATTGYDAADRPTTGKGGTGTYVYDTFGRQTTLPAVDAPDPSGGNVTLGYFDDDQPRTVTQGGTSTTFTLDANGRRSLQTTVDATGTTTTTRRYADDGDNPAWVDTTGPNGTSTTRFTESLGGDLSATIAADGGLNLSLANPHGDVVTGVDIPAAQAASTSATAITGWATYDEYGNNTGDAGSTDQVDGPLGYGWLGAKQRATSTATAGLTLMGVRFYNAARGLFTSLDPVPGGNDTAYNYPNDPVNQFDIDGQWKKWKKWGRNILKWGAGNSRSARWFRGACGWAPGLAGTACGAYLAGSYAYSGNRREAGRWAVNAAASAFGGGMVARGLTRGLWVGKSYKASRRLSKSSRRFGMLRSTRYMSAHVHGLAASAASNHGYSAWNRRSYRNASRRSWRPYVNRGLR